MTRIDMTTREWHELIKAVMPHVSTDKEMPELGVVRLEVGDSAVYTVATDRYTMGAERWPLPAGDHGRLAMQPVHLDAKELAASLKLFTHSKDEDPLLRITIDEAPIPISVAGRPASINHLAVTVQQVGEGTRLVLHDARDPSRDPMARLAQVDPRGDGPRRRPGAGRHGPARLDDGPVDARLPQRGADQLVHRPGTR
jgi:hypothetical protein